MLKHFMYLPPDISSKSHNHHYEEKIEESEDEGDCVELAL